MALRSGNDELSNSQRQKKLAGHVLKFGLTQAGSVSQAVWDIDIVRYFCQNGDG